MILSVTPKCFQSVSRRFFVFFFKEMDLKGLEQVKTCGLNSNSGHNSKDHPGLNHSQRVPGAGTQTRDEGHTVTTCGFYR